MHDMSPWLSQTHLKEKICPLTWQDILKFTSIDIGTKLCHDIRQWFMGISFLLFWTMRCSFNGSCDIQYFKISTASDGWFSRCRSSNVIITSDFALVLHKLFVGGVYNSDLMWANCMFVPMVLDDSKNIPFNLTNLFYNNIFTIWAVK